MENQIRINKRIKDLGLASRREADEIILSGKVLINGKKANIGDKVSEADKIEIIGENKKYIYYTFYKPKGVVSHSPQYGEKQVKDFFPDFEKEKLTIIGRLDKHSEGLMFVTNDKRLVERILQPEFAHEREYEVTVQEKISNNMVKLFEKGFTVRDRFVAKPAKVIIKDQYNFNIILTEGKKHQIRLMAGDLHYTVSTLKRVRIMNIKIGKLTSGNYKKVEEKDIKKLLTNLGLK
jgi:23S rRNA pseudouridine2604 synthase